MEGLARVAAGWVPVVVDEGPLKGTYELAGMELDDYAAVEQHLLSRRRTPMEALDTIAEKVKNPRLLQMIARMAYNDVRKPQDEYKVPVQDVYDWLDSIEGLIFTAYLCLKKRHPDMTQDRAKQIMNAVGQQQFKRLRDQASGTDERGNETGPNHEGTGMTNPEGNGFPGGATTATSPSNTAGDPNKSAG